VQGPIESNGGVKVGTPLKRGTHWTPSNPSENLRKHFPNGQMIIRSCSTRSIVQTQKSGSD
jgi:hypothetical protein